MKTITISQNSSEVQALLEEAVAEDVIVRLADGRQFILSAIDDFDSEIVQTRRNQTLMTFLEQRAQQPATLSVNDIKAQLGLIDQR